MINSIPCRRHRTIFNLNKFLKFGAAFSIFILSCYYTYGQKVFRGHIMDEETMHPISYASVGVMGKEIGSISDSAGTFKVNLPNQVKENDTILITSVGYHSLKVAVKEATKKNMFQLKAIEGMLPSVMVYDLRKSGDLGDDTTNYSFYRGWYEYRTGGEIGRVINVLHKKYKLNRIVFQVDNKCDTCWLRLRVRKVTHFQPAEDLLQQSVIIPVTKHTPLDGVIEFDISDLGLLLREKKVYIGFEVIDCKNVDGRPLSLCFIGADYGEHYFRKFPTVGWTSEDAYGLYLKMFFDY
jgi:CarboxypepD_reg-like domain